MSEKFSFTKFFSGLWGITNYAKAISLAIKIGLIAFLVILVINFVDRILPKKQTHEITTITEAGGKTEITNIYNKERKFFTGIYGGVSTRGEAQIGLFGGIRF